MAEAIGKGFDKFTVEDMTAFQEWAVGVLVKAACLTLVLDGRMVARMHQDDDEPEFVLDKSMAQVPRAPEPKRLVRGRPPVTDELPEPTVPIAVPEQYCATIGCHEAVDAFGVCGDGHHAPQASDKCMDCGAPFARHSVKRHPFVPAVSVRKVKVL